MKATSALMLAFAPAVCLAAGYGGAEGRNRAGEILHIELGDQGFALYVPKNRDDITWTEPSREHYSMARECPAFDGQDVKGLTFTCPPHRDFPLSGATYKVATSSKWRSCNAAGTVYVCVHGCGGKRTPKIFHVMPWEC